MTLRTPAEPRSTSGLWYNDTTTLSSLLCHQMEGYHHIAKAALDTLYRLSHHTSESKATQNGRRLKPRKGAGLIVNMT